MPCSPGMKKCPTTCLHKRHVRGYNEERQRQETKAEEDSSGYATELASYLEQHPLLTFKDWLIHTKGWSGREEVPDVALLEGAAPVPAG